jgi:hypothetical protein
MRRRDHEAGEDRRHDHDEAPFVISTVAAVVIGAMKRSKSSFSPLADDSSGIPARPNAQDCASCVRGGSFDSTFQKRRERTSGKRRRCGAKSRAKGGFRTGDHGHGDHDGGDRDGLAIMPTTIAPSTSVARRWRCRPQGERTADLRGKAFGRASRRPSSMTPAKTAPIKRRP